MASKMKPLPPNTTLADLLYHRQSRTYRQVSRILHSGAKVTSKDLGRMTNVSMGSVLMALKTFKDLGIIHICGWEQGGSTNLLAVYKAGSMSDVAKPSPLPTTQRRTESRKLKERREQDKIDSNLYQQIATALVPHRTPEQVAEINRLYLQWISEGVHG